MSNVDRRKCFSRFCQDSVRYAKIWGGRDSNISVHLQIINTEACFRIGISLLQNISLQLETFPFCEHQPAIIFNLKLAKFEAGDK